MDPDLHPASPVRVRRPGGAAVHVCWVPRKEARPAALAIAVDTRRQRWDLPESVAVGDVIVTVLGIEPALVACLESVHGVSGDGVEVRRLATYAAPVPWRPLAERAGIPAADASRRLDDAAGDRLLDLLGAEVSEPVRVPARPCTGTRARGNDAVYVLRALSLEATAEGEPACEGCGAGMRRMPGLHRFGTAPTGTGRADLEELVADAALLCADCHEACHIDSLAQVRRTSRPRCPQCGTGNPRQIVWGFPTPEVVENDDYAIGGCIVGPGIQPKWLCRGCPAAFTVQQIRDGQSMVLLPNGDFPGYWG